VNTPPVSRPAGPALSPQASQLAQSLGNLSAAAAVSEEQREQLVQSLVQAARGEVKPSEGKVKKLAGDLARAVEGTDLNTSRRSTLASQLEHALNESLGATEMEALASQVQETLRGAGAGKVDATIVANDLKSIIAELRRGAKN
jgi:hemolysin activation/secretion protein